MLFLLLVSCSHQPHLQPNIVVEGWIEQGKPPVVMLHESVSSDKIGDWYTTDELKNLVINWGKVTISDGEKDIILTGKTDTMFMPPYIYTTGKMLGEAGKRYSIKVEYSGLTVTGETQLLTPPSFEQIEIKQLKDNTFSIIGKFVEKGMPYSGYALFGKKQGEKQYTLCFNGVFSSVNTNDTLFVDIFKASNAMSSDNGLKTYYVLNDTISIRFSRLDEQAYEFWNKYQSLSFSNSLIFSPVYENYPTNLTGGLGYFFAYGATYYNFILNMDTVINF